jgi:hypothetical protein
MNEFSFYSQTYWSESLNKELEIWYGNVEHEPENGIEFEFEWEALDTFGKDHKDDLTDAEHKEIEKEIYNYLFERLSKNDDY